MNSLEVNLNGYVQTPSDYHLHINGKCVMLVRIQSTTGHEKSCGKQGGPPSKAKYYSTTDSE